MPSWHHWAFWVILIRRCSHWNPNVRGRHGSHGQQRMGPARHDRHHWTLCLTKTIHTTSDQIVCLTHQSIRRWLTQPVSPMWRANEHCGRSNPPRNHQTEWQAAHAPSWRASKEGSSDCICPGWGRSSWQQRNRDGEIITNLPQLRLPGLHVWAWEHGSRQTVHWHSSNLPHVHHQGAARPANQMR